MPYRAANGKRRLSRTELKRRKVAKEKERENTEIRNTIEAQEIIAFAAAEQQREADEVTEQKRFRTALILHYTHMDDMLCTRGIFWLPASHNANTLKLRYRTSMMLLRKREAIV